MQNGLPYMWAVVIPAFANLAWGIVVWATVPARPEQVNVRSVDFEMASRVGCGDSKVAVHSTIPLHALAQHHHHSMMTGV